MLLLYKNLEFLCSQIYAFFHIAFSLINISLFEEQVNINSYFLLISNTGFIKCKNGYLKLECGQNDLTLLTITNLFIKHTNLEALMN